MPNKYNIDQYDLIGNILSANATLVGMHYFPQLREQQIIPGDEMLPVNYLTSCENIERTWFHHFVFDKVQHKYWYKFDRYAALFRRAAGLISTDFSLNRDDEEEVLIQNCYKNRVMAYAMQRLNQNTIPTAGFGGENT